MFEAEARWLRCALDAFPPARISPLLNLGSGSADIREVVQPWIEDQVFRPLRARNVEVAHVDRRDLPGVDVRADLTDPADVGRLSALRPRALLCCNLLEHVIEPNRLARHCLDLVTAGGLVFTGELTGEFIAVDSDTGKILWQFQTPSGIIGQPVTWERDGKQYVTVTSGVGGVYVLKTPDPNLAHVPPGGSLWTFKLFDQ